jgi:hypothetical protein
MGVNLQNADGVMGRPLGLKGSVGDDIVKAAASDLGYLFDQVLLLWSA